MQACQKYLFQVFLMKECVYKYIYHARKDTKHFVFQVI